MTIRVTDRTSHSELSKLAMCEKQWAYRYLDHAPIEEGADMTKRNLGTAIGRAANAFWQDQSYEFAINTMERDEGLLSNDNANLALWLMNRYHKVHAPARDAGTIRMVGFEIKLTGTIPGTRIELLAYLDNLALDPKGDLWLVERKTMRDWRRLNGIAVDPQVSRYVWLARSLGLPVRGVLYDAIRTYYWKRDEAKHPANESFRTLWLDRTEEEGEEAVKEMQATLKRRAVLLLGDRPIRNIGQHCDWCDHQEDCWNTLSFPYDGAPLPLMDKLI